MARKMMKPLLSVVTPAHCNKSMLSKNAAAYDDIAADHHKRGQTTVSIEAN
jgi:hypothetical protein